MFKKYLSNFLKDERGVTAIEYAVIGVALAAGLVALMGTKDSGFVKVLVDAFTKIASNMGVSSLTLSK
ncbi:Flp family type IVb pilin [Vibrio mediterranei]